MCEYVFLSVLTRAHKLVIINHMVFSHEVRQVHGTSADPEAMCADFKGRERKGREKEVPDIM